MALDMADDQLNEQESKDFYTMADTFIDIANGHCEKKEANHVGSSMLFAAARFSSFVVASQSPDKDAYEAEIETATEFFTKEFKRMLTQNLEDYKTAFKAQAEEEAEEQKDAPRYEHLKKKD